MSALGLEFYPAIILILIFLFKSYIRNRHEFIVQLTLFVGAYGLYDSNTLVIKQQHLIFIIVLILATIYYKPPIVKRTFFILGLFLFSMIALACFSELALLGQIPKMRHYLYLVYFYIPLIAFDGIEFNFNKFMTHVIGYTIVIGSILRHRLIHFLQPYTYSESIRLRYGTFDMAKTFMSIYFKNHSDAYIPRACIWPRFPYTDL